MDASIVIPTKNGGALLDRTLRAIFAQRTDKRFEVIAVDSGSNEETLAFLRAHPVDLVAIPAASFNHGLTRDLGASRAKGEFLLFLNQDATPGDERWLDRMLQPMLDDPEVLAVQGHIRERDDMARFFWHSCGPRFYFSSESVDWIRRYHGIGFSTVNCAMRRSAWTAHPFGRMDIFEDKGWQKQVHRTGREIATSDACVLHTHDYDLAQLRRRCLDEGYGWRLVGERYPWWRSVRDMLLWRNYVRLARGLVTGKVRKLAEVVYPFMRPRWLYRGNRHAVGLTRASRRT